MTEHSKLEQYAKSQQILLNCAQRLHQIFTSVKSNSAESIETIRNKMKDSALKVVVLGSFKRGKSTFINSLLGEEILPNFATPCTAVINEVKWGEEKKAVVHFKAPGAKLSLKKVAFADLPVRAKEYLRRQGRVRIEPLEIGINELEDYVVIKDPENGSAESIHDLPYDHVEIFWPLPLLKNGVVIIDSPGLDECESRSEITRRYLDKADVILFVMSCSALASQTEMNFIDNMLLNHGYEDMVFICNRYDEVHEKERERVVAFARRKLGEKTKLGAENGVFFLSAASALEGRIQQNEEMIAGSGLLQLEQKLYSTLVESRGRTKLLQPARLMMRETSSIVDKIHGMGAESLEAKIKLTQRLLDYIKLRNKFIPDVRDSLKEFLANVYALNNYVKGVFATCFDDFINASSNSMNGFSPQKTIGLLTIFSDASTRSMRINDAATDMYPQLIQIVSNEQRNLVNAYYAAISDAKSRVKYDLCQLMNSIFYVLKELDDILYPRQIDQGQALEDIKVAFESYHVESQNEKNLTPDSIVEQNTESDSTNEDNEYPGPVSEAEIMSLLGNLGADKQDFYSILENLFPLQSFDYISYFYWGNAVQVLAQSGFNYVDTSRTTNDIKIMLRDHLINRIDSQKNFFLQQHMTGWDDLINKFIMNCYRFFCEKIDSTDKVAETFYREELLGSDRATTFSDSTEKELSKIRSQIEETVFELVS
ncbi:MAG: dynamin family protein [Planctomycetia bacterium]|nr:dynamin family protein [Planctomycetia bacterium]